MSKRPPPPDPHQQRVDELWRNISHLEQRQRELQKGNDDLKAWMATYGSQAQEERCILAEFEGIIPHLFTLYFEVVTRAHPRHGDIANAKARELARHLDTVADELRLFASGGQIEGRIIDDSLFNMDGEEAA